MSGGISSGKACPQGMTEAGDAGRAIWRKSSCPGLLWLPREQPPTPLRWVAFHFLFRIFLSKWDFIGNEEHGLQCEGRSLAVGCTCTTIHGSSGKEGYGSREKSGCPWSSWNIRLASRWSWFAVTALAALHRCVNVNLTAHPQGLIWAS